MSHSPPISAIGTTLPTSLALDPVFASPTPSSNHDATQDEVESIQPSEQTIPKPEAEEPIKRFFALPKDAQTPAINIGAVSPEHAQERPSMPTRSDALPMEDHAESDQPKKSLAELPIIQSYLKKYTGSTPIMKILHKILFNRPGQKMEVKSNINKFAGADKATIEQYKLRIEKCRMDDTRLLAKLFGLPVSGGKEQVTARLLTFLSDPKDPPKSKVKTPTSKKRATPSKARKTPTKSPATKPKKIRDEGEDSDDAESTTSEEEEHSDFEGTNTALRASAAKRVMGVSDKRSVSDRGEETPARKKTKVGDRNAKAFLPETEELDQDYSTDDEKNKANGEQAETDIKAESLLVKERSGELASTEKVDVSVPTTKDAVYESNEDDDKENRSLEQANIVASSPSKAPAAAAGAATTTTLLSPRSKLAHALLPPSLQPPTTPTPLPTPLAFRTELQHYLHHCDLLCTTTRMVRSHMCSVFGGASVDVYSDLVGEEIDAAIMSV